MTLRSPRALLGGAAAVVLFGLVAASPAGSARPAGGPEDRRVLVFAVPGLTWKDVDSSALPNLQALLDDSAVANVATRVTGVVAEPGAATALPGATVLHVTLAMDAGSVEKVVFAAEYGKLWLSAQPENAPPTPTKTQSKATVNA